MLKFIRRLYFNEDVRSGFGLGMLFAAPLIAWSVFRSLNISSPSDIVITLLLGIAFIFFELKKAKFRFSKNPGYRFGFLLLSLFLISLFLIGDMKNFEWVLFGLILFFVLPGRFLGNVDLLCKGFLVASFTGVVGYMAMNFENIGFLNSIQNNQRLSFDNEAFTLTAYAAASGLLAAVFLIIRNGISLLAVATLLISAYVVILSGTRSVYGGILLASLYIMMSGKGLRLSRNHKYKKAFYLTIIIILVTIVVGLLSNRFEILMSRIVDGVYSLFGDNIYLDDSAEGRKMQRNFALNLFYQYPLLGAGIKSYWTDFPLLQIFSDMGIFIGSAYLSYFFIYPLIKCFVGFKRSNPMLIFLAALYLLNLPRMFLHGQPYDWEIFIYCLPLLAFNSKFRRSRIDNE